MVPPPSLRANAVVAQKLDLLYQRRSELDELIQILERIEILRQREHAVVRAVRLAA